MTIQQLEEANKIDQNIKDIQAKLESLQDVARHCDDKISLRSGIYHADVDVAIIDVVIHRYKEELEQLQAKFENL